MGNTKSRDGKLHKNNNGNKDKTPAVKVIIPESSPKLIMFVISLIFICVVPLN